jgi:hypothetical protein
MKRATIGFLLAGTVAWSTTPANACSCAKRTQAQAIASADIVFQGRVVDVRREGQALFATISVLRPIKGDMRTTVEVGTRASTAACGYAFRRGQLLIVGASFRQRQYRTNNCLMFYLNRK